MHIVDIASIYRILSFGYMDLLFYIRGGLYNKCDICFALCNTRLKKKKCTHYMKDIFLWCLNKQNGDFD